ncbi:hypothetical protein V8G54_033540 [Vigna mungo]|uniref:Uncharacterized protein n=1 Tax=Vigna mungo TaxID=3915 RepID=A0AAQ3RIX0_VIGMU
MKHDHFLFLRNGQINIQTNIDIPVPLSDLERIGFSVSARSQVFDSPLSKAWCGFDSVCRIAHPISKSKCCGDFMDAIQNSLQQKLSRLSQVDSFFSSSLHSSYEYPLFPHSVSPTLFFFFYLFQTPPKFQKVFNNIHTVFD